MTESNKTVSSLKSLISAGKTVDIEYPGMPEFKLSLSFLSREDLTKIRKKSTTSTFKKGAMVEVVNDDLFLQLYTQGCIKGWEGLKLAYVDRLAPIDLEGHDPEATLEFSQDNALFLMQQSNDFDSFISQTVTDLGNFPSSNGKK